MQLGRWSLKSLPGGHQRYVDITLQDRRARLNALYSTTPLWDARDVGFNMQEEGEAGEYVEEELPPQ